MRNKTIQHKSKNIGIDFSIIAENSVSLMEELKELNKNKEVLLLNVIKSLITIDGSNTNSIKIVAYRYEKYRSKGEKRNDVYRTLVAIKKVLNNASKSYTVNTYCDFAGFSTFKVAGNSS